MDQNKTPPFCCLCRETHLLVMQRQQNSTLMAANVYGTSVSLYQYSPIERCFLSSCTNVPTKMFEMSGTHEPFYLVFPYLTFEHAGRMLTGIHENYIKRQEIKNAK